MASAFLAVHWLKEAIRSGDSVQLQECVEFPTLRQNLKDQVNAKLEADAQKKAAEKPDDNFSPKFVSFVAGVIAEKIIDAIVTPKGISRLAEGKSLASENGARDRLSEGFFPEARYTLDDHRTLSIWFRHEDGTKARWILSRSDLSWRLTNIILSDEALTDGLKRPN